MRRTGLGICCLFMVWVCSWAVAQPMVTNGLVQCVAIQEDARYIGFRLQEGERPLADILFHADRACYATQVSVQGQQLLFSGFRTDGSWEVAPDAIVSVSLATGNPYPQVAFRIPVRRFSPIVWEATHGKQPLHLFACSLPGAPIFHQRGWVIPTPVIDEHVMHGAFGTSSATIVSAWSPDWSYAPAIGAYPVPVVGLWKPDEGKYLAYEFFETRLSDHSERNLGSSYCWRSARAREFFCLTLPYAKPYNRLRYPEDGDLFASRFRIIYHTALRHDDDPNLFINQYVWRTYRQQLASAPAMNNLKWLPQPYRLQRFAKPVLGRLLYRTKDDPFSLDGNLESYGVGWDSPIDYVYAQNDQQAIEGLREDLARLAQLAQRFRVNGEECVAWRKPLEGDWRPQFGKGVPTLHNVNNWLIAIAFIDAYRNERNAEWLPLLDGVVRWSKYILYTRNCYPDVPAAMFAWDAAPAASFLLKYYFTFRDSPERAALAQLAYKLSRSLVYRCLPIFASDNNPNDDIDASFLMEPNSGLPWLGSACANEIWETAVGILLAYVHTGDPILAQYLRGMLERFPTLFRDEIYPSVAHYNNAFAERYGLFDGAEQPVGTRSVYGGLWGGLERLVYPVDGAQVRVVCGERAAMAFNIDGVHTDIAEYRPGKNGDFTLRLRGTPPSADAEGRFRVVLTFPLADLRAKRVFVNDMETGAVLRYPERLDTLVVLSVRAGDWIRVGEPPADTPPANLSLVKPRPAQERLPVSGFEEIPIAEQADVELNLNWDDPRSMAGFYGGLRWIWGVPFALIEPTQHQGKAATRRAIRLSHKAQWLFALVSDEPNAQIRLTYANGRTETIAVDRGAPAIQGWPPLLQWRVWMVSHPLTGELRTVTPQGCALYALTLSDLSEAQLQLTLSAMQQKRQDYLAEQQTQRRWQSVISKLQPLQSIAVLPTPLVPPHGHPLVKGAHRAREFGLLHLLTPEQLVTPSVFNPTRYPLALYLGGENYYQTVRQPGDGEQAVIEYLRKGGNLLVSPTLPYPFYYNERGVPTVFAPQIGLPISGRGIEGREERVAGKEVRGWERPPQGVALHFIRNPKQKVLTSLPDQIPFPTEGDLRWRPMVNIWDEQEADYTPILTLVDDAGKEYGDAIAVVEFRSGQFRGAKLIYIWHRLTAEPETALLILGDVINYLSVSIPPPAKTVQVPLAPSPPIVDGKLDEVAWRDAAAVELSWRFNPANSPALLALTPTVRTTARLLWDTQFLYVGFECEDADVWSNYTQRDAYVWEGEAVGLYLDPLGKGLDYKEIAVNPLGALIDRNISDNREGKLLADGDEGTRWSAAGIRWAVAVQGTVNDRNDRDRSWSVEIAIPLQEVVGDAERVYIGDTWRFQLYRVERPKDSTDATAEFQAWNPTDTLPRPERFGLLAFSGSPRRVQFDLHRDGSDGSPVFQVYNGSWQIRNGVYEGKNCIVDGWLPQGAALVASSQREYTLVRMRYRVVSRGSDWRDGLWIGLRQGEQATYAILFTARDVQLHKVPYSGDYDGDKQALATAPFTPDDQWHDLVIRIRNGEIEVEQDERLLLRYVDPTPLPNGAVVFCGRKWSASQGDTLVQIASLEIQ